MSKLSVLATLPFFFQLLSAQAFQPSTVKGFFVEQFNSDSLATWSPSEAIKEGYGTAKETMQYNGQWAIEAPTTYPGISDDLGLVVKSAASHHAISVPFPNVLVPEAEFRNGGEALVVQYEVKLQKGLDCGGAYIKLLSEDEKGIQAQEFSDKTPYTIMFGPDRCGGTQKVHLIIRHKNPITGEITEKHLKNPPTPRTDKLTHLYTLIIKPDQTYEILIDEESQKTGSLLEDFNPPFNPPEEIDDPEDKKPEDWVDKARIPDPGAVKPEDWDEDAPRQIPDLDVEKPEDWLEEESAMIPDPKAEKPEEWDDEEDGDWIAPSIPNPKCEDVSGCGEWKRPNKPNPDYKGKWTAPMIDNPDYIGVWKPRKIANPDYYHDANPANLSPIAGIGIELWTMTDSILFDNFFISFSPSDAKTFASETFGVKRPIEEAAEEAERPAKEEIKFDQEVEWSEDPVGFAKNRLRTFVDKAVQDPVGAFKEMPQTGSMIIGGLVGLVGMLGVLMNIISASPAPAKAKNVAADTTAEVSEKVAQAKSTATEAVEESTTKKRAGKAKADE